ncbi:hypothetical protein WJ972_29840 [Achromobacter insuavis]
MDALESLILADASGLGVLELDWRSLNRFLPSASAPKFSGLAREDAAGDDDHADTITHMLTTLDAPALHTAFSDILKAEIGEILRVPAQKSTPNA